MHTDCILFVYFNYTPVHVLPNYKKIPIMKNQIEPDGQHFLRHIGE